MSRTRLIFYIFLVFVVSKLAKLQFKRCLVAENDFIPLDEPEHPAWPANVSRSVLDYMRPDVDTAVLKPLDRHSCVPGLVWIFVTSLPEHFDRRQLIRETWGNMSQFNELAFKIIHHGLEGKYKSPTVGAENRVEVIFLLGRPLSPALQKQIEEEHLIYGDILQEDFLDSEYNETLKSLFMLKWVTLNDCVKQCKKNLRNGCQQDDKSKEGELN